jgi:phosphatidylglycerol---prolipoprotein diacylglyceryl transferase
MLRFMTRAVLFKLKLFMFIISLPVLVSGSFPSNNDNPVINAVLSGNMVELKMLLSSGAPINVRDSSGNTPLTSAALIGDEIASRMLLDHGATVDFTNRFGSTPLLVATTTGNPKLVEIFLERGAKVDAHSLTGSTPLIAAAQAGDSEIVKILLAAGADATAKDTFGKTASDYANENRSVEVLDLLLNHEKSINFKLRAFFGSYPFIDPIAFKIGRLGVRWYGLMYLLGAIACTAVIVSELSRRRGPIQAEETIFMVAYGLVGILVGGRLGVIIFHPAYFFGHPLQILAVWLGGISLHGALIGILVSGWLLARRRGLPLVEMADIGILALPLGIMFVRIGNFINGELVGTPTTLPWAIVFPGAGKLPRHPSQLYGAFLEGLVLFIVLWLFRKKARRPGQVLAMFLLLYGVFRFVLEFFREPGVSGSNALFWLTTAQMLSVIMVIAGAWVLLFPNGEKSR